MVTVYDYSRVDVEVNPPDARSPRASRQEPALSGAEKRTAKSAKDAKVGAETKGRQER
jgi:hypothetical protein